MTQPSFQQLILQGSDAAKFLQGQITSDVSKLSTQYQSTAIANLKGRVEFGLWIKQQAEDTFAVVISEDCLTALQAHIKKFGAFSKFTTAAPIDMYPCLTSAAADASPTFSASKSRYDLWRWQALSVATGNYWITAATQGMFQPQELRLHQRGGIDYDKGCYLGQEVIARIYFKSAPKAYLHRVQGQGMTPNAGDTIEKIKVVNAKPLDSQLSGGSGFEALVVATPEHLAEASLKVLDLPPALQANVARH